MNTEIIISNQSRALSTETALATTAYEMALGLLSIHTRRAYLADAKQFITWLMDQKLSVLTLTKNDLMRYRLFLKDNFARTTASRKLVVARKLLEEAVEQGLIPHNPAQKIKGYPNAEDDGTTPHQALKLEQARQLLGVIDTSSKKGKRDYAIIVLLLRTGLRRDECAQLQVGDLCEEQGHYVLFVRHAKGNKRRKVKVPVDVMRAIEVYLVACNRTNLDKQAPLFVQFRRGDHAQLHKLDAQVIWRLVQTHAAKVGLKLSPHGLRATFVTLALEGGAKLEQVQYAVGHADPRTTERYQSRKLNLDNHAVDYIKI